jgi:Tfp pilus assembly protein PilE
VSRTLAGFSLVELLGCLLIVGVLTTSAVATYREATLRARRSDAREALFAIQLLQERHYFAQGRYADDLPALGDSAPRRSPRGYYVLELQSDGSGQRFFASALAAMDGPQAADSRCRALTLDETGRRGAHGSADAARCWN